MKYRIGDLIVNFQERNLFFYTEKKKDYLIKRLHRCRLATPGERRIFIESFPKFNEVTFNVFKASMPVFDSRKIHGVVYSSIELDENAFIFFRDMKVKYSTDDLGKLQILITKYIHSINHNKKADSELSKKQRKSLELLQAIGDLIKA